MPGHGNRQFTELENPPHQQVGERFTMKVEQLLDRTGGTLSLLGGATTFRGLDFTKGTEATINLWLAN